MSKIHWGQTEAEFKRQKKQEKQESMSIDQALSIVPEKDFNPNHSSYSTVKTGPKEYRVLECKIDLSTLQAKAFMLDSKYDTEARAQLEANKLIFEQIKKNTRENK